MNILQYKLNAIMAKSRAVYGKRLTGNDYESLLSCTCVSDITSYLRSTAAYSETLKNVPTTDISTGHLEFLVRKNKFEIFSRLSRYEMAFGQELYNYFVKSDEISCILFCIRNIILGKTYENAVSDTQRYTGKQDSHISSLTNVHSFEELIAALDGTPYRKIVEDCHKSGSDDYVDYECEFNNYFKEYEYQLVRKTCGAGSKLMKLLNTKADTEFINNLLRIKKFYSVSSDRILRSVTPVHLTNFTQKEIKALLGAQSVEDVLSVLKTTRYKDYAYEIENEDYAEQAIAKLNYKTYKYRLRFSGEPSEVLFCFMFLIENEVSNLIHIIEGVKYKMDSESIRNMLIGVGD